MKRFYIVFIAAILACAWPRVCSARGYCVDTVRINNGTHNIFGLLSRPAGKTGALPLAIIAHGFNNTHRWGKELFGPLAGAGYMCYSFDFPCGSVYSLSDNNTMNMSPTDEASDLESVVRYFKSRSDTDPERIILIGESQGGLVSALVAANIPDQIEKLVLIYPGFCIPVNWNIRYPSQEAVPDTTRVWNVPLGRKYFEDLRQIDIFGEIGKYSRPVLIVHGDKDTVIPPAFSEKAVKIYPDARLHMISGAGHGFNPTETMEMTSWILPFLNKNN